MQPRSNDHTVLILLAALFLFISPLTSWWSSLALPWYSIFCLWGVFVLLIAANQRWQNPDDH